MTKKPALVSIIVPTYKSAATIENCLKSIQQQTYDPIELIVVDNHSADNTAEIAKKYTDKVFIQGPERSAQRNFGVEKASGEFVVIIDSDMELTPGVVAACVEQMQDKHVVEVVIPEESFGDGFWAACKRLERSFYVGVSWIEAARFFRRQTYLAVGGYDTNMVSGEDWDLSQRMEAHGKVARVDTFILHNEGRFSLVKTLKKKYYYAGKFTEFTAKQEVSGHNRQPGSIVVKRFKLFLSQPKKLFKNPLLGLGVLWMKVWEFGFGGLGYVAAKFKQKRRVADEG